jgi:hypothetical protein
MLLNASDDYFEEICITFSSGNHMRRVYVGNLEVDGRIKFKMNLLEERCEDVNWIRGARNTVQWPVTLDTVMNLHI